MAGASKKSMDQPDERRTPDKTTVDIATIADMSFSRATFKPGWSWSSCIKPVAGTDTCQARHIGYAIAGKLHVVHDDGSEIDLNPGDAYIVEPGHDASIVGNDDFVGIEISAAPIEYAKGS